MSLLTPYSDINTNIGQLTKTYVGTVVDNADPLHKRRLRIRIPELHGDLSSISGIPDDKLPWAISSGLSLGNNTGMHYVPAIGTTLWVKFDEGDIYSPVYYTSPVTVSLDQFASDDSYLSTYGIQDSYGNVIKINQNGLVITNLGESTGATIKYPTVTVDGNLVVTGSANISGNTDIGGTLHVAGAISSDADITASGNVTGAECQTSAGVKLGVHIHQVPTAMPATPGVPVVTEVPTPA